MATAETATEDLVQSAAQRWQTARSVTVIGSPVRELEDDDAE